MRFIGLLAPLVLLTSIGHANTIWVPDDHGTIQAAVLASVDGDEIIVRPGSYSGFDFLQTAVAVRSELGPEVTTIIGTVLMSGVGPGGGLEGFKITSGSGVRFSTASPLIKNNIITGNYNAIERGGGMYFSHSSPSILDNVITNNQVVTDHSTAFGGGIYSHLSSPIIRGNTISGNEAIAYEAYAAGGGIYCRNSTPIIEGNTITQNRAVCSGGIYSDYQGIGGGLGCEDCDTVTIEGNTIAGNTAETSGSGSVYGFGGGILCFGTDVTIRNNLVCGNTAITGDGGGIICSGTAVTIAHNTICTNQASNAGYGGGLLALGTVTATDTILWGNDASLGPEILVGFIGVSTNLTISYSDVDGGQSSVSVLSGTLNWGAGMIDADPLFVDPLNDDYRLQQDPCQPGIVNPCVDTGDPTSAMIIGTTRTDGVQDLGTVDLGYHHLDPYAPGIGYCFGDPGSGTPCPCNNDNDGLVPGSGCANGAFASGSKLVGSGVASVTDDTLILSATALDPNNSGLYLQADNDLSPGIVWGDGLQCAGGQLRRLGVRFADSAGYSDTAGLPLPISVKAGNVAPGDTKRYQLWYRDTSGGQPCGVGVNDFNATNGYEVVWFP